MVRSPDVATHERLLERTRQALAERRFDQAETLLSAETPLDPSGTALALCRFGQRCLRLDVLDLDDDLKSVPSTDRAVAALRDEARSLMFPHQPHATPRGSLTSMVPLTSLLLEALDVRWRRDELLHVLSLMHLVGEYMGHLAWESVLGHAGDPLAWRGVSGVAIRGAEGVSRWGDVDAEDCGHSRSFGHLARQIDDGDPLVSVEAWDDFLRSDYSRVSGLVLTCATRNGRRVWGRSPKRCDDDQCPVWWGLTDDDRTALAERARIAHWYRRSPLVALRHAAPIGHFFGVPDTAEITAAFDQLAGKLEREGVTVRPDSGTDIPTGTDPDVPARMAALVSLVAGTEVRRGSLLARIADEVAARIH